MWKEVASFWSKTYKKELSTLTNKLSASTVEERVFNNFSEEKAIASAKNYVTRGSFNTTESSQKKLNN